MREKPRTGGRRWGSLICHAGFQALAILALANAMIPTTFGTQTLLITTIRFLTLQATAFSSAVGAAIPLTAITVAADVEHPAAGRIATNELVEDAATGSRHGPGKGVVDNCADHARMTLPPLESSVDLGLPMKNPGCSNSRGSLSLSGDASY
jgi:hypothetical protein